MPNQDTSNKTDKTGGDVTKSEVVPNPAVEKTLWDYPNTTGSGKSD